MEATSSFSRPTLRPRHFLGNPYPTAGHRRASRISLAGGGDDHHQYRRSSSNIVDEHMIVLRMRIKEMKALESADFDRMGWEKDYSAAGNYKEDICETLGVLQGLLMEARPALGLGMTALVLASVPLLTFLVILQAVEMAMALLHSLLS